MSSTDSVSAAASTADTRAVEASIGQRLLWLLDHYRGGEGTINVPIGWRIRGPLDHGAMRHALDALVARHEPLRTTYAQRGRRLVQLVHAPEAAPFAVVDVSGQATPAAAAAAAMDAQVRRNLDPTARPLEATLWRISGEDHLLLVNIHHLATDFFSNMILTRDLGWLYDRAVGATDEPLPEIGWSYAEWARWQHASFAEGRLDRLQAFWRERLAGAELAVLPRAGVVTGLETRAPATAGDAPGKTTLDLDPALVARLRELARGLRTTMFPVMLAAFYCHLHRLTAQRDLSVASLFTNRMRPEVQDAVGFFVNMIVLRGRLEPEMPFSRFARETRTTVVQALAHADLPYQMLPPRTMGRGADDIVFQYLEAPPGRQSSLDVDVLDITVSSGRFALELVVYNQEHLMLRCNRDFSAEWALRFLAGYGDLLAAIAQAPESAVRDLG